MNHLFYAKVCMVFTIGLAGLNIHQLLSSYQYVKERISEFQELLDEESGQTSLYAVSFVIYVVIPAVYLIILAKANFIILGILLLLSKFIISAALGLWTQKKIFSGGGYTKGIHLLGKCDNLFNIFTNVGVLYLLLFPL